MHFQLARENLKAGEWRPLKRDDGSLTASIGCPTCGGRILLLAHRIAVAGDVAPSVICPRRCGFHEFVILDQWGNDGEAQSDGGMLSLA